MAKTKTVEPTVTDNDGHGSRYEHPAYATIGASRMSARPGVVLFGTDFLHRDLIVIAIRKADMIRNLSQDWIHGGDEYIEVALSEAQWATFVSSLNVGTGVACTLQHLQGKYAPGIPYRVSADVFPEEVRETINDALKRIDTAIANAKVELASASAKKRDSIIRELELAKQEIEKNLPFVVESFGEHMEDVIEHAKIEVNAYTQTVIQRAGIAALASANGPIQLGAGEPEGGA